MSDTPQFSAFSTADLLSVVQIIKRPANGIRAKYFGNEQQSQNEFISFDIDEQKRYVAPFVHSSVAGKIRAARGQQNRTFAPAYIKQKTPFNPNRSFTRAPGEAFMGTMTPQERLDMALKATLQDHTDAVERRLELMAVSALLNGKLTITGEDYPTQTVDFQRKAALNLAAVAAADKWDQASSDPFDLFEDNSGVAEQESGSITPDIVMDGTAWRAFRKNPRVKEAVDLLKLNAGTLDTTQPQQEGIVYRGSVGGYNIYTYSGYVYDDRQGVDTKILTGGYVMGVGAIDGITHFGAIHDFDAMAEYPGGIVPVPVYPKSWVEKDPSALMLLTQSAPLVVPRRVNASWVRKVL